MDKLILESIIDITSKHDIDSLEISLLATLADLTPLKSISLYKPDDEGLKEILQISVADSSGVKYQWSEEKKLVESDENLQQCLNTAEIIQDTIEDNLIRYLFPVLQKNKIVRILDIHANQESMQNLRLLESVIKIYGNYFTVLNESERDQLTGLLNRRTFNAKLDKLLKEQRRKQELYKESYDKVERRDVNPANNAWLAIVDIDKFKRINDTYGHVFGDEVILMLSQKMRRFFRSSDLLFRFGGEEFVIILEPLKAGEAGQTFERFRKTVSDHVFPQVGNITISTGYVKISEFDQPVIILERADKALYYAKENGRNVIYNYDDLLANGLIAERKTPYQPTELF